MTKGIVLKGVRWRGWHSSEHWHAESVSLAPSGSSWAHGRTGQRERRTREDKERVGWFDLFDYSNDNNDTFNLRAELKKEELKRKLKEAELKSTDELQRLKLEEEEIKKQEEEFKRKEEEFKKKERVSDNIILFIKI